MSDQILSWGKIELQYLGNINNLKNRQSHRKRKHQMNTHIGTHTSDKDNAPCTFGYHFSRSFSSSKERSVNIDIIQTLDPIEWVTLFLLD
jgi:hypothetical protein